MCEIQFVMNKTTLAKDSVNNFTELLSKGSQSNGDATGVFGEGFTWKVGQAYEDIRKGKARNLKNYMDEYATNWLVGHNRWTTQGTEKVQANNHPFVNDTCVIVHNGMISNDDSLSRTYGLKYKAETDSAVVPELIEMFTNDGEDEVSAIKKTAELLEGSYSIFVLMKETKNLYYFKNSGTSFQFMRVTDRENNISYYGSTCKISLQELGSIKTDGMFDGDVYKGRSFGSPEVGQIYRIVYKGDLDIIKEGKGKFEPRRTVYTNNRWKNWGTTPSKYSNNGGYGDGAYAYSGSEWDYVDFDDAEKMEELFEKCILEIDYMEGGEHERPLLADDLAGYELTWDDNAEVVIIRDVRKISGNILKLYLDATEWFDTDTSKENANYSIKYSEIKKMKGDGFIYDSGELIEDKK